jgi:2'-5' RNA ligase
MRLFIAIDLDDGIKENIKNLTADLKRSMQGVKWVRDEGIHITLKFLGEVPESKVEMITKTLEQVSTRYEALDIEICHLGRFPERGDPRIIWVGALESTGILKDLALDIEKELGKIGFEREKRSFKPHVTLGRVRRGRGSGKISSLMLENKVISFGSFQAKHIYLIRSILRPDGARYEKIGTFAFRKEPT